MVYSDRVEVWLFNFSLPNGSRHAAHCIVPRSHYKRYSEADTLDAIRHLTKHWRTTTNKWRCGFGVRPRIMTLCSTCRLQNNFLDILKEHYVS